MRFIGLFAGAMVATYIAALAPFSGMSINPARSFASALPGYLWDYLWIYFTAPVLGMQLAVEVFRLGKLGRETFCAKLDHDPAYRCIHCGHEPARRAVQSRDKICPATATLSQVRRSQP
jgi:aquaporin Z